MSRSFIQCVSVVVGWIWLTTSALLPAIVVVQSAYSRRRSVIRTAPERYDRSITTFDPAGRLLQVEYGMQAASRGSPIMCVLSVAHAKLYISVQRQEAKSSSLQQVHRLDDHVFLFGTGLVGDTLFLARYLRRWCRIHRIERGEPASIREVAEEAALFQHKQTRTGGRRPFGCSVVVAGVDSFLLPSNNSLLQTNEASYRNTTTEQQLWTHLKLFRIGPGGVLEDCLYCAVGRQHDLLMDAMQQLYPTIQEAEPGGESKLLKLVSLMQATAGTKEGYDVWTIEPAFGRRGNLKTSCHLNIPEPILICQ